MKWPYPVIPKCKHFPCEHCKTFNHCLFMNDCDYKVIDDLANTFLLLPETIAEIIKILQGHGVCLSYEPGDSDA